MVSGDHIGNAPALRSKGGAILDDALDPVVLA
jgi:hypothetical protein